MLDPRSVQRYEGLEGTGKAPIDESTRRNRNSNQPWRDQRGQGRYGHRYRVEKAPHCAQGQADSDDDERELADLGQAHPGLNGPSHPGTDQKRAGGNAKDLAGHDHHGEDEGGKPVLRHERRIYQHADRHEEDGSEHVSDRLHEVFDALSFARLADQRSGQKRAQRDGVPELLCEQSEPEADPRTGDDRRFGALHSNDHPDEPRNGQNPNNQEAHQERHQLAGGNGQTRCRQPGA